MTTVLITGASGFIGSYFVKWYLNNTDWRIIALVRGSHVGDYRRLPLTEDNKDRLKVIRYDLRDGNYFLGLLDKYRKIDLIYHLAASSHVDRSIIDPVSFVKDNVLGTAHILEHLRLFTPRSTFIYFSTDEVFGPAPAEVAYEEFDRYNSCNPYAATKAGAEELCMAYANTYDLDIRVTHCMNVFGPYQNSEKFIPLCIKKILADETVHIHADRNKSLSGSRFYIHVEKVVEASHFVYANGHKRDKYNICGDEEISNFDLAVYIAELLSKDLKYEFVDFHSSRPGHDLRYALCGKKLKLMGLSFSTTFKYDLETTVQWYLNNKEWLT